MAEFNGGTPQMLTLSVTSRPIDFSYNIYNFVQARPDIVSFDISPCYQTGNRRKFDFTIPGQYKDLVDRNNKLFKYSALRSLVGFCAVSPLRISRLKIVYGKDVHIRFELLDRAPISGDVYTNTSETKLDLAAAFFIQTVNLHKFAIMIDYDKYSTTQYILATPNSIREFQYESELEQSTGYSPGALGGLTTGMAVAGGGIGAVMAFLFFK
ncbi:uncharacterized protein LOC121366626 [Gigantopelta aegis]|uniref:uncharacterized protein LOC121366626 n=1 Tax=Gigantopelta aegis TaxID=1735272 RepID=UPI001B88C259|nr:uncharacterized protein LOC121366626 [Gigantopelta aegis]